MKVYILFRAPLDIKYDPEIEGIFKSMESAIRKAKKVIEEDTDRWVRIAGTKAPRYKEAWTADFSGMWIEEKDLED